MENLLKTTVLKSNGINQNEFGLPDRMITGLNNCEVLLHSQHPLERSQRQPTLSEEAQLKTLRSTQGIHAPLRLMMERRAAIQIQRLPCLTSSYLALETLLGRDEEIGFEEMLKSDDSEELIHPHIAIEKNLGR